MFDPASVGYPLTADFNRARLKTLLDTFRGVVRREIDKSLADRLTEELLERDPSRIERKTFERLAAWCNTENQVYWDGMDVAREISQLLFGKVLDRTSLGV